MQYPLATTVLVAPFARTARLLVSWRLLRFAAPAYLLLMLVVWTVLLGLWLGGREGRDGNGVVLGPDFPAFYTGGRLLTQGGSIGLYDLDSQRALQQEILPGQALSAFVNPPHYAFVAAPFSLMSYAWAFTVWSLLMAAGFVTGVLLLMRVIESDQPATARLLAAFALLSAPVYYALSAGQNTGLSFLLHCGILFALSRRRDGLAGCLIVLGMFKPQLFIGLLPLLAIEGRWRVLLSFGLGGLLLGLGTVAYFGFGTLWDWIAVLRSPVYQMEEVRQAGKMFSWQPVWLLVLGPSLSAEVLGWSCALLVFGGLCYLWRREASDVQLRYAISLCGLMVMGPHLPVYDLALLILPGLVLADRLLRAPTSEWLWLRLGLLALYVSLLFAVQPQLRAGIVVVPLITAIAWGAMTMLRDTCPADAIA